MKRIATSESIEYFEKEKLDTYFAAVEEINVTAFGSIDPKNTTPFPPDVSDLVRLHKLIRTRKVLTVLEFGVGFSTLVIADAIQKNKMQYADEFSRENIRCLHPFSVFCVETDAPWIAIAKKRLPETLKDIVQFCHSEVYAGTFQDRLCHYYYQLPDITPDFIYVDGPSGASVQGELNGSSFKGNLERTVISADLLRIEPTLVPGTMIVFDGRTNNARFVKNNFQRQWHVNESSDGEVTTFELLEPPLGMHNKKRLAFHGINVPTTTE